METPRICFRLVAVIGVLASLGVKPLRSAEEAEPADLWGVVQATGTFSAAVARVPRVGVNLLANPGLEEGDGGPLLWSAMPTREGETLRWADDVAHTGQRGLEVVSPARSTAVRRRPDGPLAKEGKGEVVSPLLTREGPGEVVEEHRLLIWRQHLAGLPTPGRLALSGWIKTEGVEQGAALCLQLRGPGRPLPPGLGGRGGGAEARVGFASTYQAFPLRGTRDWTAVQVPVAVPAGVTEGWLMAFLQGPGTAWFDDLRLTVAAASPTALEAASRPATVRLPLPQATSTQHPFDLTLDVTPSDRDGTATCTSTCDGLATCDGAATCEGETCDGSETCDASPTCAGYPTCGTTCEMT